MDSEAEACRKSQGQIWILSVSSGLPAASEPRGSTDNLMNLHALRALPFQPTLQAQKGHLFVSKGTSVRKKDRQTEGNIPQMRLAH